MDTAFLSCLYVTRSLVAPKLVSLPAREASTTGMYLRGRVRLPIDRRPAEGCAATLAITRAASRRIACEGVLCQFYYCLDVRSIRPRVVKGCHIVLPPPSIGMRW